MAILDESPRSNDVVALTNVKLLTISAQRLIQSLFKDSQLHHRMLQLMVRRLRQTNVRFQRRNQPPAVRLAHTLVFLADHYGEATDQGTEITNIPEQDLADVAGITVNETHKILEKLQGKGWIEVDPATDTMGLMNLKQLTHLAGRV
jgi:CRP-like cAMP-binding protein